MKDIEYVPELRKLRLARNIRNLTRALTKSVGAERAMEIEIARLQTELAGERQRKRLAAVTTAQVVGETRGHAAVVSWDMGHNPVGRALVLYQLLERDWNTELIGPCWSRYGSSLWEPAISLNLNTRIFACHDLADFLPQAMLHATRRKYDLVYVCKPRLPSIILGLMIKEHSGCPLILDVDDHELSFFKDSTPASFEALTTAGTEALREPYEELATRFCETLVPLVGDTITVSNIALRRRFGGHIVRHARDEVSFAPNVYDRDAVRRELGIPVGEFALIFVGTPRSHKGIFDVARALHELNDPTLCLHIIGDINDRRMKNTFRQYDKASIKFHPNCSFADLPRILSAADAVPLLQDTTDPIASFQIPGKLSDATALGLPVLITEVPPIEDLARMGGLTIVTPASLVDALRDLRRQRDTADRQRMVREFFLSELSLSVNRTRVELAIKVATDARKPLPPIYHQLKAHLLGCFADMVRHRYVDHLPVPAKISPRSTKKQTFDMVFFWKQNDTGLYGRRSDMIIKYLLKSGRVHRIMQFDAPLSADRLQSYRAEGAQPSLDQNALVLRNTLARWERGLDTQRLKQRVFLHAGREMKSILGRALPPEEAYLDFITSELSETGFDPAATMAWVCPVVWQFPEVARTIGFSRVVADLIDDQRSWPAAPSYIKRLDQTYKETLRCADVTLTNCAPVAQAFADYAHPIHVVPNGAERFDQIGELPVPRSLAGLPRPIVGYVGNLRDRIDWDLLATVAAKRPNWSLVLAGSRHDNPTAGNLGRFPNVTFLGVVEYPELVSHLRAFDVGIVPHLHNDITLRKIYNYFAAGIPIVSTEVANMEDMKPYMRTANDPDAFIAAIDACIGEQPNAPSVDHKKILKQISWEARIADILAIIDGS